MLTLRTKVVALYVDRSNQRWIAQDRDGNYWIIPHDLEDPWQSFSPTEETELERVPGHYKYMLGLSA